MSWITDLTGLFANLGDFVLVQLKLERERLRQQHDTFYNKTDMKTVVPDD